tara:strand:- start:24 stop:710 length:687 start_codon:yes stop_codon:yes gene_type:complete
MKIESLFTTPVIFDVFDKHNYYKNEIDLFPNVDLNNLTVDEDRILPNSIWDCKVHSSFDFTPNGEFLWDSEIVEKLKIDILSWVNKNCKELFNLQNFTYSDKEPVLWYNFYRKEWYQEMHTHVGPINILSGCYFFHNPSAIRFHNSDRRIPLIMDNNYGKNIFANSSIRNYSQPYVDFTPDEGTIVLFPSSVEHSVPPVPDNNDEGGWRVSISFNLGFSEIIKSKGVK